ncbi:MAG: MFS transporter [Syntrophomonas sp.]|nr:MFS transporter [Syntrophomonas sp.]
MLNEQSQENKYESILQAEKLSYIWTFNFTLLCLTNFVLFMSTQMLIPCLPGYIMEIGGDQKDIGYVVGAYTAGAMIMRPLAGWLVDNHGRKRILLLGMIMMATASLLYIPARGILIVSLIRILHGFALALATTAMVTLVVDNLPMSRLNEGMGYFGLTSSLSMTIAPIIGFSLIGKSGYPLMFGAIIVLTMLSLGASLFIRNSQTISKTTHPKADVVWSQLLEKKAVIPSGMAFFVAAVYGAVLSFISLHAAERGIFNIGLFFTAMASIMFISRPIAGRWVDKGYLITVLIIAHMSLLIGVTVTALSQSILHFIIAGSFLGLGYGILNPTLQALSVCNVPPNRRGAATGTFFIAFDLGIGLGTILWGYVAALTNYQTMYFFTLIPIAVAGVIFFRHKYSLKNRQFHDEPSR